MPSTTRSTVNAAPSRPWGSSISDFGFAPSIRRHELNVTTEVAKKQKHSKRPRPRLAAASDELHELVEALATDEEFLDEGITPASEARFVDADDGESVHSQEVTAGPPPKKMELSDIDILIDEIERVCGPKPEMDLCKSTLIFDSGVDWLTSYPSTSAHVGKS